MCKETHETRKIEYFKSTCLPFIFSLLSIFTLYHFHLYSLNEMFCLYLLHGFKIGHSIYVRNWCYSSWGQKTSWTPWKRLENEISACEFIKYRDALTPSGPRMIVQPWDFLWTSAKCSFNAPWKPVYQQ